MFPQQDSNPTPTPLPQPPRPPLDAELQRRHEHAKAQYPFLPISEGEYIIEDLHRNIVGLLAIWLVAGALVLITLVLLPLYSLNVDFIASILGVKPDSLVAAPVLAVPLLMVDVLFVLGGIIASRVYNQNRFFLTNESIIQYVQTGLFKSKLQQISLTNVEDVSSDQRGLLQQLFNYGSIRVSTQGQHTIYHFYYLNNPDRVVKIINDATENATGDAARFWGRDPHTQYDR